MNESDPDDDRTLQASNSATTGALRSSGSEPDEPDRLPIGSRLAEFELMGFIGQGGFSMVYLAWDHSLERRVAIKEYMPSSLAMRSGRSHVAARSERHRATFDAGLGSFVDEGRLLAQFDHPSLVKVYRFWEQNGTAYMAMPFYEGATLKDTLNAMGAAPNEDWLLRLLNPLTAAISVIHGVHCFHRDISPDNVLLLGKSEKPLLLDFGAARRVIGDKTQALTVILKAGYAPIEQYAEDPHLKQGAWTDVYALAAVVYWAITGQTPPTSVGRVINDRYLPLLQCARGRYSDQFLAAIDRALRVLPDQRTGSIDQFRKELGIGEQAESSPVERIVRVDPDATVMLPKAARAPREADATAHMPASAPKSRRALLIGSGSAAAIALAGGAWWLLRDSGPPAQEPTLPFASPTQPARAAEPPTPVPLGASDVLSLLAAGRDPAMELSAVRRSAERAGLSRIQYRSKEPGYQYLLIVDAAADELVVVYPPAGRSIEQRSLRGQFDVASNTAPHYLVLAREPRDLSSTGWIHRDQAWVRRLGAGNVGTAMQLADAWPGPSCVRGTTRCDAGYDMTEVIDMTNVTTQRDAAAAPAKAATPKPADSAASLPADTAAKPVLRRTTEGKTRAQPAAANSAQCADILRRMSLGETSSELIDRLKTLGCR